MAQFPVYNASQNINTNVNANVGVERHQAAEGLKPLENLESTLTNITQKLSDAHDVMQETKAKTTAEMAFAAQEQAAQNDPNPDNAEMHIKEVNKIAQESVKGIDNQALAQEVNAHVQQTAFLSNIKIQDMFKKKQMFANDVRLDQLATTTSQTVSDAVSTAQAQQDTDNFMSTIQK